MQWSPHASRPNWVISTSNQKALLWNLDLPSNNAIQVIMHGHSRAITDINFHSETPDILATSSIDSYIHCWDLRDPRRPVQSFADFFSGANQVKWSRAESHMLASSHDNRVLIWDERNHSIPVVSIPAHSLKVNGLDFSRSGQNKLMSCSNDMTVKIWDLSDTASCANGVPDATIQTNFPVGRARHAPFGTGCGIMPLRGGGNSFSLVDVSPEKLTKGSFLQIEAVHEFTAHTEPIREFLWRYRGGSNAKNDDREFQLVTWARDNDVRMWPVEQQILEKVNHVQGAPIEMTLTRAGAKYATYHKEPDAIPQNTRTTSFRMQRGSFGTSPVLISSHLSNAFSHISPFGHHHHSNSPAMMTRAAGPEVLNHEPTRDHLRWVSGVRIGQSACATAPSDFATDENLHSHLEFNSPANLGEELSLINTQLPTINFEHLSIPNGKLTVTLNRAPSGEYDNLNELIFLRVDIQLPPNYPQSAPTFSLSDNYKLSTDAIKELQLELTALSTELAKHKKYCLVPCLRILLGEKVSLINYLSEKELSINHRDIDYDSDLSDNNPFGKLKHIRQGNTLYNSQLSSSQSSLDEVNVDYMVKKATDTILKKNQVPVARTCGAVWCKSGKLVCFFSGRKVDKPPPRSTRDHHIMADHASLTKLSLLSSPDSSDSYVSDDSFEDSNLSHSNTDDGLFHTKWSLLGGRARRWNTSSRNTTRHDPMPPINGKPQGLNAQQPRASEIPKNVIVVRDFRHLIPARPELAAQYAIMGSSPQLLCQHNSIVARKYGCIELANCWRLLEMILTSEVNIRNLEGCVMNNAFGDDPGTENMMNFVKSEFQWGNHPFGRRWLVERLFSYFEKRQDPQMLANMSCIFASVSFYSSPNKSSSFARVSSVVSDHGLTQLPAFRGTHQDTIQGPLSNIEELVQMNAAITASTTSTVPGTIPIHQNLQGNPFVKMHMWDFGSASRSDVSGNHMDDTSFANEKAVPPASPEKFVMAKRAVAGMLSRAGSFSHAYNPYKANNNVGNNTNNKSHITSSASFVGLSQWTSPINTPAHSNSATPVIHSAENSLESHATLHSALGSPPKRPKGENNYSPGLNIGGSSSNPLVTRIGSRVSIYDNQLASETSGHVIHLKPPPNSRIPKMKLTIINEELLDDESSLTPAPLLDQSKESKYKGYRMQYAGILFSWGLEIESLEVLKFNYLHLPNVYYKTKFQSGTHVSCPPNNNLHQPILVSTDTQKRHSEFDSLHLAKIVFHRRPLHDQRLKEKDGFYSARGERNKIKYPYCQYCHLSVTEHSRYFFCLRCEHIMHDKCAEDWFAGENAVECSSGCGCLCLEVMGQRNLFFSELRQ